MKKTLLSSFFVAFCAIAMAQVKPAAKQAPIKAKTTTAAQRTLAERVAFKNKVMADQAKGLKTTTMPVVPGAADLDIRQ